MRIFTGVVAVTMFTLVWLAAVGSEAEGEPSAETGFRLFSRDYMVRCTYKTSPRPGERLTGLKVFGSPGEYEPVTLSIRAHKSLPKVSVELDGDLVSTADKTEKIAADAVDIRVVMPMSRWLDKQRVEELEYLLMKKPTVDLAAGRTRRFWITVKIPTTAAAGRYEGKLQICQDGALLAEVPYEIEVLPIQLAELDDIAYFMYFPVEWLPEWAHSKAYLKKVLADMKEHGINATTARTARPDGHPLLTTAMPGFLSIADTLEAIDETKLLPANGKVIWIWAAAHSARSLFAEEVRKRGYEMVFYAIDEPGTEEKYKQVRAVVPMLRKNCPGVPIATAISDEGIKAVGDYYDIWIRPMVQVDEARIAEAKRRGKRLWIYECQLAPTDTLTSRYTFGYGLWRTGATGASFWAYCSGGRQAWDRFGQRPPKDYTDYDPSYTHYYDFVWCVPDGPIPSVGWEAAREGIDDYRYLRTLEQLIAKAQAAGKGDAAQEAMKFLKALHDRIPLEKISYKSYAKSYTEALERGRKEGRKAASLFDRASPVPWLKPEGYSGVRRRVAEHIIRLQKTLADN